jgi:hypothetical protein
MFMHVQESIQEQMGHSTCRDRRAPLGRFADAEMRAGEILFGAVGTGTLARRKEIHQ